MVDQIFVGSEAPIAEEYREMMNRVAGILDVAFNGNKPDDPKERQAWIRQRKIGFMLLVVPFGHETGRRVNYITNANTEDILPLLKEMVSRFEGMPQQEGHS